MLPPYDEFKVRADSIRAEIAAACSSVGRDPVEVKLMAVTKTHPPEAVSYAARYGLESVGENRVQEAAEKRPLSPEPIRWELIGHLQSNKAALAARLFDRIQSVDSPKLAERLARAAGDLGRKLPVLLQINAGRDPAKFGAELEDAPTLLEQAMAHASLEVQGFMTIAPLSDDPSVAERTFFKLRELRDALAADFRTQLPVLSMGMTGDFKAAVAAGSTQIRVGTALYGARI